MCTACARHAVTSCLGWHESEEGSARRPGSILGIPCEYARVQAGPCTSIHNCTLATITARGCQRAIAQAYTSCGFLLPLRRLWWSPRPWRAFTWMASTSSPVRVRFCNTPDAYSRWQHAMHLQQRDIDPSNLAGGAGRAVVAALGGACALAGQPDHMSLHRVSLRKHGTYIESMTVGGHDFWRLPLSVAAK